ncbi:MAG TPA: hypothetical protein V6D12_05415, partial [Candidatus Obscuribacterales bacterium]
MMKDATALSLLKFYLGHIEMQTLDKSLQLSGDRPLIIAGKTFQSRLMTGTGKYRSIEEMQ